MLLTAVYRVCWYYNCCMLL